MSVIYCLYDSHLTYIAAQYICGKATSLSIARPPAHLSTAYLICSLTLKLRNCIPTYVCVGGSKLQSPGCDDNLQS